MEPNDTFQFHGVTVISISLDSVLIKVTVQHDEVALMTLMSGGCSIKPVLSYLDPPDVKLPFISGGWREAHSDPFSGQDVLL